MSHSVLSHCLWAGGYVKVRELLDHQKFKHYSEADIRRVVSSNDKQRYSLKTDAQTGELMICANQGHSFEVCLFVFSFFFTLSFMLWYRQDGIKIYGKFSYSNVMRTLYEKKLSNVVHLSLALPVHLAHIQFYAGNVSLKT